MVSKTLDPRLCEVKTTEEQPDGRCKHLATTAHLPRRRHACSNAGDIPLPRSHEWWIDFPDWNHLRPPARLLEVQHEGYPTQKHRNGPVSLVCDGSSFSLIPSSRGDLLSCNTDIETTTPRDRDDAWRKSFDKLGLATLELAEGKYHLDRWDATRDPNGISCNPSHYPVGHVIYWT